MTAINGTVEAISNKYAGKIGVLINEKWYNSKLEYLKVTPQKGDVLSFDDGGKNYLNNLEVVGSDPSATSKPSGGYTASPPAKKWNNLGVELGHASNVAKDMANTAATQGTHTFIIGDEGWYKFWVMHTEKVFSVMTKLRAKHEAEPVAKAESSDVVVMKAKTAPSMEPVTEADLFEV
jgi:hypothetical protein